MAYKSKARRKPPELRRPVDNNGSSFEPGKYQTVIVSKLFVRKSNSHTNLQVYFENQFNEVHVESIYCFDRERKAISQFMRRFLSSVAESSAEMKELAESILDDIPDTGLFKSLVGRKCLIKTAYYDNRVRVEYFRRYYDSNNSGKTPKSVEADTKHPKETDSISKNKGYISLSESAKTFF